MENQILDNETINQTTSPRWAGFWIRTGASLIDVLVYLPLIGLNMYNLYTLKILPLQLAITLLMLAYKPFMEFKYGATVGKMAVKIKVTDENFNKISLSQAIIRYTPWIITQAVSIYTTILLFQTPAFLTANGMREVGLLQNELMSPYLSFITSGFFFVVILFVAFTEKKQGLHDMLAKTYCVYK